MAVSPGFKRLLNSWISFGQDCPAPDALISTMSTREDLIIAAISEAIGRSSCRRSWNRSGDVKSYSVLYTSPVKKEQNKRGAKGLDFYDN